MPPRDTPGQKRPNTRGVMKNKPRNLAERNSKLEAEQARLAVIEEQLKTTNDSSSLRKAEALRKEIEKDRMDLDDPDNAEPDSSGVKEEDGLFVPHSPAPGAQELKSNHARGSNSPKAGDTSKTDVDDDGEETVSPQDILEELSPGSNHNDDGDVKHVGWVPGVRGVPHVIVQYGPQSVSRYRMKRQSDVSTPLIKDEARNLSANRPGENKINGRYEFTKGCIKGIQGVAWVHPDNDEDPLKLLNPKNWPRKGEGKRRTTPYTLVKVKLLNGYKDGVPQYVKSWETRSTVRRLWSVSYPPPTTDIMMGDKILIPKNQSIKSADVAIIMAAKRFEEKYQKYRTEEGKGGEERSPSPDPALKIGMEVNE
ncbi:Uu.00g137070.m01.CDS01 [Anthostomella pinea]|uniref:Uu.00g137070.m01.CDS01 n=1 Tax=Anthostomella pinea TaxID=933095 RepID=A0AAI8VQN0_9PEZI|nr:Uu.00g137070.m01.CDS01 [Anthostomella pinea]